MQRHTNAFYMFIALSSSILGSCKSHRKDQEQVQSSPKATVTASEDQRAENRTCRTFARSSKPRSRSVDDLSEIPLLLSKTGCVDETDPKKPAAGLIPYDIVAPLWSDGSDKERYFAIPDGQSAILSGNGHIDLPNGSVTMKTFKLKGRPVETRLYMREADGSWAGYSYAWRDDSSDAELVKEGREKIIEDQTWVYPSRQQCGLCHNKVSEMTIGFTAIQFARKMVYKESAEPIDQLKYLAKIGVLKNELDASPIDEVNQLVDPLDQSQTIDSRARSYLHANCSFCHQPDGGGIGNFDLRFQNNFSQLKICGTEAILEKFGISDAKIYKPGAPNQSVLYLRMKDTSYLHMPPLISKVPDARAIALINDWILLRSDCDLPKE